MKYSIIIPTYNHFEDEFHPFMKSLIANTNVKSDDLEVIIVCNGCTDGTQEYLQSVQDKFSNLVVLDYKSPLGYTISTNLGIKASKGDYVICLNNDVEILGPTWLGLLEEPFKSNNKMGITGCHSLMCPNANREFLLFFCVMIKRELINTIGLLDECFSPGAGEDTDYCCRAVDNGYLIENVDKHMKLINNFWHGSFPLSHHGEGTVHDDHGWVWKGVLKKNSAILKLKYNNGDDTDLYCPLPKDKTCSIILPISNLELSKPSLESILQNTSVSSNVKICVVLNGCRDLVINSIQDISDKYKRDINIISTDNLVSETQSINMAIKSFPSDYYILLAEGAKLQSRVIDRWLEYLYLPFHTNERVGITGPKLDYYAPLDSNYIAPFCMMFSNKLISDIGLLDESLGRWNTIHTSIDLAYRATQYNEVRYELVKVIAGSGNINNFPIVYTGKDNSSTEDIQEQNRNATSFLLTKRMFGKVKLNLGCGDNIRKGYLNLDKYNANCNAYVDIQDLSCIPDGIAEEVFASHILEHINPRDLHNTLQGIYRVMADGAKLIIEQPDLRNACKRFLSSKSNGEKNDPLMYIYGDVQQSSYMHHIYGYDSDLLIEHLTNSGFKHSELELPTVYKSEMNMRVVCYKFTSPELDKEEVVVMNRSIKNVSAVVCTKDRYHTTLSHTLLAIAQQTYSPKEILIFDDSEKKEDLRNIPIYKHILKFFYERGIEWKVIPTEGVGQVQNHNASLDISRCDCIWRLDDDTVPDTDVLEQLIDTLSKDKKASAVGGLVLDVTSDYNCRPTLASNKIEHIYRGMNEQWFKQDDTIKSVDHLYSSFLYSISEAKKIGGYCTDLSRIGHREETIFTYSMKHAGYNILINPNAITWHLENPTGGVRNFQHDMRMKDEHIFITKLTEWGVIPKRTKIIVLDNGLGDHFCFKNIIGEIKEKYHGSDIIIACCYNDVFFDIDGVKLVSIREIKRMIGDIGRYNIYHYCDSKKWESNSLVHAFTEMYL